MCQNYCHECLVAVSLFAKSQGAKTTADYLKMVSRRKITKNQKMLPAVCAMFVQNTKGKREDKESWGRRMDQHSGQQRSFVLRSDVRVSETSFCERSCCRLCCGALCRVHLPLVSSVAQIRITAMAPDIWIVSYQMRGCASLMSLWAVHT